MHRILMRLMGSIKNRKLNSDGLERKWEMMTSESGVPNLCSQFDELTELFGYVL